jgi:uncharacterized protein
MLTVLSPAKKLNETPQVLPDGHDLTTPAFAAEALTLAKVARKLTVEDLRRLMGISEPLARLNQARFAAFRATPNAGAAFSAVQCFAGDTYTGLEAGRLSPEALRFAAAHLRILSGLYGLLRPFDAIQPYRLEMGSRLGNARGGDLYAFWGDRIAKALNALGQTAGTDLLVNCASVEYFTAANRKALKLRVITPVFLEERGNEAKVISFWAKKARGTLARFICENQITDPAHLRQFDLAGYAYCPTRSTADRMVFARAEPAQRAA